MTLFSNVLEWKIANQIFTLVEERLKLPKRDCPKGNQGKLEAPYAQAISILMYVMFMYGGLTLVMLLT